MLCIRIAHRPNGYAIRYPFRNFLLKTIINRFLNAKTPLEFEPPEE